MRTVKLTVSLLTISVCSAMLAIPAASATPTKKPSPSETLGKAVAAGEKMRSVHFVSFDHLGKITISQNGNIGPGKGDIYSVYKDGKASGLSQELFTNGKLFLKANSSTLISFFGFKKAGANKYGNKWVYIPKTDVVYANLTPSLTLAGQMQQIKIPGKVTYLKNPKINGKKVIGILGTPASQGGIKEKEVLYISPSDKYLPIKATLDQSKTAYAWVSFSKWNEIVKISVPSRYSPIGKTGLE